MNYIESKENKKIKFVNKLSQRKYREEFEVTLVEGLRSVKQVIESDLEIQEVFVSENKANDFLKEISISKDIVNVVKEAVFSIISETVNSQGIITIVKKKKWDFEYIIEKGCKILVLDRLQDPGNVGTIFRTAIATDYDAVLYTKGTVDIFSPKVNRSAMGANLVIPSFEVNQDCFEQLRERNYRIYATIPHSKAKVYTDIDYKRKFAVILGNEANGIDEKMVKLSDEKLYIPMSDKIESLNVSIAAAVIMFKSVE